MRGRVNEGVATLVKKMAGLMSVVSEEIGFSLRERFPGGQYESIIETHKEDITRMKNSLYEKYSAELVLKMRVLYLLREDVVRDK